VKLDNSRHSRDSILAMKSHFFTQLILSISLSIFSITTYAEQWYHVELIVFEQLDTVTDEQWPEMAVETNLAKLYPTTVSNLIQPAENETLLNSAARLQRSQRYQVHYHQSWQQPVMKKHHAQAINIIADNNKLEGTIKLYKSTYLHAALDLWLKQDVLAENSWSDVSADGDFIELARNPNLKESRRIRSKKLYFFDHPKLGALLQLTPIDTPVTVQASEQALESFSLPTEAVPTKAE